MLEKYYMYKSKYKDYILLIKTGNFYEIIGKYSLIMNSIFRYKITRISNTIKCGFPLSSISKVKNKLNNLKINYVIVEESYQHTHFKNNNYYKYDYDVDNVIYNFLRIDKITKFLNDNVMSEQINDILDKMEKLICKIN